MGRASRWRGRRARARAEQSAAEQSAAAGGNRRRTSCVAGPETRTTATPARPGAVESAKMVSAGASRGRRRRRRGFGRARQRSTRPSRRRRGREAPHHGGRRCPGHALRAKEELFATESADEAGCRFYSSGSRDARELRHLYVCVSVWNLDFGAARRRPCFERLVAPHSHRRASSPPPAKMGKPKGKRAHRKIDVGEDAYIEKKREDAAAGGAVDELPDDSLFFVDNDGGIAAGGGMAMPTSRKAKARAKTLRVDAILTKAKTARPFAVPVPRGSRAHPPRRSTPRAPSSRRPPRRSSPARGGWEADVGQTCRQVGRRENRGGGAVQARAAVHARRRARR